MAESSDPAAHPWRLPLGPRDPSQSHRQSTNLELLFDLCFIVAVAYAGLELHHAIAANHVGAGVASYLTVFFAIWCRDVLSVAGAVHRPRRRDLPRHRALAVRPALSSARNLEDLLMHTIMVIGGGLLVLALFVLTGRQIGGGSTAAAATAALWFIPVWLVAATINLWIGVNHGYTVGEELPIALIVFGLPAAVAAALWWRFSRG